MPRAYLPGFDFKLFKNTPAAQLADAVEDEDIEEIRNILRNKSVDVDFKEPKYGHTLLMLAVADDKQKSTAELLEAGANPNLRSNYGDDNALTISIEYNDGNCDTMILRSLIHHWTDLNAVRNIDRIESNGMHTVIKDTPLMMAARNDCFPIVKCLVENGADINKYTYYDGFSAITESIIHDNLSITKYLLIDKQADIPQYCFIRFEGKPNEQKLTLTDLLNEEKFDVGSQNYKLRETILEYLNSKGKK